MSVESHSYGLSVIQLNNINLSKQLSVTKKNIFNLKLTQPSKGSMLATHASQCPPCFLVHDHSKNRQAYNLSDFRVR